MKQTDFYMNLFFRQKAINLFSGKLNFRPLFIHCFCWIFRTTVDLAIAIH